MEFNEKQPIYLQIAEQIIDKILEGSMERDNRIPSVRELAVELEVNPNTVMRTYSLLQNEEIIYNKRGIGYFVGHDAVAMAKNMRKNEFVNEELPHIFKTMELIQMDFDDLKREYEKYNTGNGGGRQ